MIGCGAVPLRRKTNDLVGRLALLRFSDGERLQSGEPQSLVT